MTTYHLGTVIHGTLLASDLIPAFMLQLPADHRLRREYDEHGYNVAEQDDLLDALFDALDALAPDGAYFGAHPGDGSDFGFWPQEDAPANCTCSAPYVAELAEFEPPCPAHN